MQKSTQLNRRLFLGSQIALATTVGLGATAFAREKQLNWETGTADQFEKLVNQQFTAKTNAGNILNMTLIAAEAGNSGPARPKSLPRSESVSLTFKSDFAEDLAAEGAQSVWLWNSMLGDFNMYLDTVPRRSGGYDIVAILN